MDGELVVQDCDICNLLDLLILNHRWVGNSGHPMQHVYNRMRYAVQSLRQFNPVKRAQRNVAHHYDLDANLHTLLLDVYMQY